MPSNKQVGTKSFVLKVSSLSNGLQFYWFLGHVLSVIFFTCSFVFGFFSPSKSLSYYRFTLFFELLSYGIVIKQIHYKTRQANKNQLLKDENVQYFLFAVILFASSFFIGTLTGSLYSYVIFSFFHSITYFQAHLLDTMPISIASQADINSRITFITANYNQQALILASAGEVMILSNFLWTVPGLLLLIYTQPFYFVVKLLTFASAVIFVKLRYNDSQYTKTVVQQFDMRVCTFLSNPAIPQQISRLYNVTFKDLVVKYVGPIKVPASSVTKKTQ